MAGYTDTRIALLSIHPEFAQGILAGQKRVEFRRRCFASPVSHVIAYATAPACRVVGYFEVAGIDLAAPEILWRRHGTLGLISKDRFDRYFDGVEVGCAILIGEVTQLARPWRLKHVNGHGTPPQSFSYVDAGTAVRVLAAESR